MTRYKLIAAVALVAIVAIPSVSAAQNRRGGRATDRAVARRTPPRIFQPGIVRVVPSRPYYFYPYYGPSLGLYYGRPWGYSPYWYGAPGPWYGYGGYGYGGYGYGGYGYGGYGYPGRRFRSYGGVRLDLPQRHAEVYADGYYAGNVDDFDGVFQELHLEAGPHRIEIRESGFEPIAFDVNIEPGRTITYRADMRPIRP